MRFYIAYMATVTTQHGITVPLDDGIISRRGNFGSHRLPPWGMTEFSGQSTVALMSGTELLNCVKKYNTNSQFGRGF